MDEFSTNDLTGTVLQAKRNRSPGSSDILSLKTCFLLILLDTEKWFLLQYTVFEELRTRSIPNLFKVVNGSY